MTGDFWWGFVAGAWVDFLVLALLWLLHYRTRQFWKAFVDALYRSLIEHGWTPPKPKGDAE